MKRRLRKKRRLHEFRQDIFGVRFCLRDGVTQEAGEGFHWRFVEQAIEANDLMCGGGGGRPTSEFYVQAPHRRSPTEAQRAAVAHWLAQQPEVETYQLSEPFDGWHGPDEAPYTSPSVRVRG